MKKGEWKCFVIVRMEAYRIRRSVGTKRSRWRRFAVVAVAVAGRR